ncbi:MAG: tetratricopeptide repeat protein [Spirochaetales bacterium]|nr:tetratricopeptide repeat protein [Spirochaetales bacterium]
MKKIVLFFLLLSLSISFNLSGQENEIDLNDYYKFPFSVGVGYQSLTPLTAFETGAPYTAYEASVIMRLPLGKVPVIQPAIKGGMISYNSNNAVNPDQWDHNCYFGSLGLIFSNRFSKNFEIGAELLGGYSYASFENLGDEVLFSNRLTAEAGLNISLIPSYSMAIDITPNIRYFHGLESFMSDFNGFTMGIGFSASFRFGEDPDSPQAVIRSLKLNTSEIPPLFAAMQSYYIKHPIGSVEISNIEKSDVKDLQVSFFQPGFMDSPTPAEVIDVLEAGETVSIDLLATFNSEVFNTEGVTPLTGEVITSYTVNGKYAEQRQSVGYDLYDKRSMTWDDDRKVAAFITPADTALQNYTSYIRTSCKGSTLGMYSGVFQSALQVFNGLNVLGVLYQSDPTSPFTSAQGDTLQVDTVSLPRMTLKKITGDCDDLTVLYSTLLETLGIQTAIITVPGHIYMAFNTREEGRDFKNIHPDRGMTINIDNQLWIPIEITMIGKADFLDAWRKGAEEWNAYESDPESRALHTIASCRSEYRPIGLMQSDLGLQYGSVEELVSRVDREMEKHMETIAGEFLSQVRDSGRKQDYNRLGVFYSKFLQIPLAEEAFEQALTLDSGYLTPVINMGNLRYLNGDYDEALSSYEQAMEGFKSKGRGSSLSAVKLMLNMSKVYYEIEDYEQAKDIYSQAEVINPDAASAYSFLGTPTAEGASRASDMSVPEIMFFEDEE